MVRAWRALTRFEDRAGLRPWLYRIATNVCIDMLKGRAPGVPCRWTSRRSARRRAGSSIADRRRPGSSQHQTASPSVDGDPAEHAVSRESVRLAFIAALQHLAPRQRAVLILRDVLRWRAAEVATLLDTSPDAVNSALRRARAALEGTERDSAPSEPVRRRS